MTPARKILGPQGTQWAEVLEPLDGVTTVGSVWWQDWHHRRPSNTYEWNPGVFPVEDGWALSDPCCKSRLLAERVIPGPLFPTREAAMVAVLLIYG